MSKKKPIEAEKVEGKEEVKSQEVAISAPTLEVSEYKEQRNSVEAMIYKAIEQKVDPDTMQKFLDMRRELKKEWAKEQFDLAMAKAQGEFPEIKKTTEGGKTKAGEVAYWYATIDQIVNPVKPILTKYGLSYTIKTEFPEGKVKSTCIVRHIAGHSEESEMIIPIGNGTNIMSQAQNVAAASTFAKRYAFMNAFGIMTGDEDKEQNLKQAEVENLSQIEEAKKKLDKCMTLEDLKKTWFSFPKEVQGNPDAINYANQIKENIKNEKAQNGSAQ